jgi:hypothetical protein
MVVFFYNVAVAKHPFYCRITTRNLLVGNGRFVLVIEAINMSKYILQNDIKIFYVTAKSFPGGITDAYDVLKGKVPQSEKRTFIGFSCPNVHGEIIYNAAVIEKYDGEGAQYGFEGFTITKGEYVSETITKWKDKEATIEHTFRKLVRHPNAQCPCVEMYSGDDMVCLVKVGELA